MKHYNIGECVFAFAGKMFKTLRIKEDLGFNGWNIHGYLDEGEIAEQIQIQIDKSNWIHVACFAMFAWNAQSKKRENH